MDSLPVDVLCVILAELPRFTHWQLQYMLERKNFDNSLTIIFSRVCVRFHQALRRLAITVPLASSKSYVEKSYPLPDHLRDHYVRNGTFIGYPFVIHHGQYCQDSYGYEMKSNGRLEQVWTVRLPRVEGMLPPFLDYPFLMYEAKKKAASKEIDDREETPELSKLVHDLIAVDIRTGAFERFPLLVPGIVSGWLSSSRCVLMTFQAGVVHYDFRARKIIARCHQRNRDASSWGSDALSVNGMWVEEVLSAQPRTVVLAVGPHDVSLPPDLRVTVRNCSVAFDQTFRSRCTDWHLLHEYLEGKASLEHMQQHAKKLSLLYLPTCTLIPLDTGDNFPRAYYQYFHFTIVEELYMVLQVEGSVFVFDLRSGRLIRRIDVKRKQVLGLAYCRRDLLVLLCHKTLHVIDCSGSDPSTTRVLRKRPLEQN